MKKTSGNECFQTRKQKGARHIRSLALGLICLVLPCTASAQEKLSVNFQDIRLEQAITQLQAQCGCFFIYNSALIDPDQKVSVNKTDAGLSDILTELFKGTNVRFKVDDKQVVLYVNDPSETTNTAGVTDAEAANSSRGGVRTTGASLPAQASGATVSTAETRVVSGVIKDEAGVPLIGATVVVKGSRQNAITDADGQFSLNVAPNAVFEVSFMGYATIDYPVNGRSRVDISMNPAANRLKDVVVIGNIERKKESFTGSAAAVSGAQLKQMGAANMVESLKSLDPSFVVITDLSVGANPNAMPTIEMRGRTAIDRSALDANTLESQYRTDPNQPLFILDGFETTLQKIVDLDMNRIESVQLLKDAASTAFYGSRAANGVVVVRTVQGEPGRFRAYYNGDYSLQIPDLSSYNMMNAREKLEFEYKAGRYTLYNTTSAVEGPHTANEANIQSGLDIRYANRLADVNSGIDTYWLSEPLRTAFINRQSVRFSGGSKEIVVDGGLSYRHAPGVMKDSKRESWAGNLDFTYNKGQVSIVNRLDLSGYTAAESPYGAFSTWVNTNPYYRKTDDNGKYPENLEEGVPKGTGALYNEEGADRTYIPNPLYNAMLTHKNQTTGFDFDEKLQARWNFYQGMHVEGMLQITSGNSNRVTFKAPEHTDFRDVEDNKKGDYNEQTDRHTSYVGNLMYVWMNNIGKHSYVLNVKGEIAHQNTGVVDWSVTGFPYGTNGSPRFAGNYPEGGRPNYFNNTYRRANFLGSVNYAYDNRYLFDLTYRLDGATVFGSAKKFTPFASAGVGWNMHEEYFIKGRADWLTQLRLRATVGQTGNQNIGQVLSNTVYSYLGGSGNTFGTGIFPNLNQLGNPNIEWQKTIQTNLGLDFNLFNSLLVGRFEVYEKKTDPLIINVDQAPSTGVSQYPMNMGQLTQRGLEFDLTAALIRSTAHEINWRVRVMGTAMSSKYSGFGDRLEKLNEAAVNVSNYLYRFRDGYSPRTIWTVESLGIDPATGQELFLNRFGYPTFVYNTADEKAMGLGEPAVQGTINSYFTWKRLTLTIALRYSLGEDRFNTALREKVENIGYNQLIYNNQDRRALYDRWQKPGDVKQFKSIRYWTPTTPVSSRFIQTENYLSGETVGLSYYLDKTTWIRHIGMERLTFNATATGNYGIFRLSNIRYERGINYPEAYTVNLSVSATF